MSTIKKILLAVDPFANEPEASAEKIASSIKGFATNKDTVIEAIYVMTPNAVGIPLEKFPEHQDHYKGIATKALKKVLIDFENSASTKITILSQGLNSVRASVESLLKHIEHNGGDLIALSTHARKGMDRFFLGSFAETLLLRTAIPLLISNPTTPWDPAFNHILFATDFSEGSCEAFDSTIAIAKQLGAKVTLFHRLDPESPFLPPPAFIAVREWEARKIDRQTKALKLKDRAESTGVRVDIEVAMANRRVPNAILDVADQLKVSLIAMGARQSSDFLAMGSIPRQVVRGASCPVLILPSKNENKSRSKYEEI